MFLQQALEQYVDPSSIVLDLCAAPGGKSTLISEYLGRDGLLLSNEVVRQRVFILSENVQKWGNGNTVVTHNTAEEYGERCKHLFDCIVVDAPCSGSGTWRRCPDAPLKLTEKMWQDIQKKQAEILDKACTFVIKGGLLHYMTCSILEAENQSQMRAFLKRHKDFKLVHHAQWTPAKQGTDGFFLATFQKKLTIL